LCAATLRPYARRLTGVDVSRAMLARARARALYDELAEREVTAYLEERPEAFDLIAAADTLIYFGALERWLGAAAHALRPAGRLLVTLELLDEAAGVPHRLNPTGRYAHAETYVLAAFPAAGLAPGLVLRGPLRLEAGRPVNGLVVLARRAGAPG
jgi:predicted TPR repeat methyltransferase